MPAVPDGSPPEAGTRQRRGLRGQHRCGSPKTHRRSYFHEHRSNIAPGRSRAQAPACGGSGPAVLRRTRIGPERGAAGSRRREASLRRRQDHHDRLGSRIAVPRPAELLRPPVGKAHRLQGEGRRGPDRGNVHQDHAGVPRRHGRLRRPECDPRLDARPRAGRRARATGQLRGQVRLPGRAQDHRAHVSRQPDDRQREDLRLPGRWRRVRHVLPQGHPRGREAQEGVQGQVQV